MNSRSLTPTCLAFLASLTAALAFTACSDDAPRTSPPPTTTGPAPTPMPSVNDPASAGVKPAPPLDADATSKGLPASHPPLAGSKSLVFTAPEGWVKEAPAMAMRREQYRLPKQGADTADAVVTVSVLAPTDGGPTEPNLQRWAGQFSQPDGSNSREALKSVERKLGGMEVIDVDVSGTYVVDETAMGGSKKFNEPNWRMLLAWVRAPSGNYYVKLVGPAATVAHWEPSFRKFVDSSAN